MQYSLVPGTNQLIQGYPGYGSQLFQQYGYNIQKPRYRDYYNMLRGDRALQFADSLAQLLLTVYKASHPGAVITPQTQSAVNPTPVPASGVPAELVGEWIARRGSGSTAPSRGTSRPGASAPSRATGNPR